MATALKKLEGVKRGDIYRIDPRMIKVRDGFNWRRDFGDIEELAAQIEQAGLLQPLEVEREGDEFFLVDGERRFKAITLLVEQGRKILGEEITDVRCEISKAGSPEEKIRNMFQRNGGKPFTALEERSGFQALVDSGKTQEEIASLIGKSISYVSQRLSLSNLADEVVVAIEEGVATPTAALHLAQLPQEQQREFVNRARKAGKKLKVAEVLKEVKGGSQMISARKIKNRLKDLVAEQNEHPNNVRIKAQIDILQEVLGY